MALLRNEGQPVSFRMLNAEYPAEISRQAIKSIRYQIEERGLDDLVTLDTVYYTDTECLERLADADLVVFPYQTTQESSSAAVRHAIASGAPVAVTPLAIFEDVAPAVIELPGWIPRLWPTASEKSWVVAGNGRTIGRDLKTGAPHMPQRCGAALWG